MKLDRFHLVLDPLLLLKIFLIFLSFIFFSCKADYQNSNESQSTSTQFNVFNKPLTLCSTSPVTGYYRNGFCESGDEDLGVHTVCVKLSKDFLQFSLENGNDLISPNFKSHFPGLKPGDKWCVCAERWSEADDAGKAPKVILESSHIKTLQYVKRQKLEKFGLPQMIY